MDYTNDFVALRYHTKYNIPKIPSFSKWECCYSRDLLNMYNNYVRIIDRNYPDNKIDWNNDDLYKKFVDMLYKSSSKYIEPFI